MNKYQNLIVYEKEINTFNNIINEIYLKKMKLYIFENYNINFVDDIYGYSKAISYTDKKNKIKFYLYLSEYIDKSSKYIGYEYKNLKDYSSSSGPVTYYNNNLKSFYQAIDFIMIKLYKFNKLKIKQLSLFN